MMKLIMMAILICCAGCSAPKEETPQAAAAVISELLQQRNYSTLFQERYSEWHKVEAEGVPPEVAISKLTALFEKQHDTLVDVYNQLAKAEFTINQNDIPQKTETGDVASATISLNGENIPYRLYKMKTGLWGFHL
ncbi:MAG TPA: hypothetical protein VIR63_03600 [Pontiella sp.]